MDEIIDQLISDINKFKYNIGKNFAELVANELTKEAKNAIDDFYNQYDPEDPSMHNGRVYYYRHWNFRKSFRTYYKNRSPKFVGGVELLQDELPDVYSGKNSSPQSVFDRVYLGLHGIASLQDLGIPRLKPTPIRRILEKQKYIVENQDLYTNKAINIALRDTYNYL